jgi:hypothetical protein
MVDPLGTTKVPATVPIVVPSTATPVTVPPRTATRHANGNGLGSATVDAGTAGAVCPPASPRVWAGIVGTRSRP